MATTLITTANVRALVESDLADSALEVYIDDADALIRREFGAHYADDLRETQQVQTVGRFAHLPRRFGLIQSVTERYDVYHSDDVYFSGFGLVGTDFAYTLGDFEADVEVPADRYAYDDYEATLRHRYRDWRGVVSVTGRPVDENAIRTRVLVDLVKLALVYRGVRQAGVSGAASTTYLDYEEERENILQRLRPKQPFIRTFA